MANKTKNIASKAKKSEKPVETPPVEETPVQVVNPNLTKTVLGTSKSGLDPNHRVELMVLADSIYKKDPEATQKYGQLLCDSVNQIVAMGVVAALADEAIYGDSTFALTLKASAYPQLLVAANEMGIKLPELKALALKKDENGEEVVEVKTEEVKVSKEAKAKLKEEHEIQEAGNKGKIELDPKKVAELDEDALVSALKYMLITGPKEHKTIKDTLTTVVDFMRDYRMALADKAEKPADAKDALDERSVFDWLTDAFTYVTPTHLLSGIGRGMVELISVENTPVSAFITLRNALTAKGETDPCWDDQSIADAVRAIVKWKCDSEISEKASLIASCEEALKKAKKGSTEYTTNETFIRNHKKEITNAQNVMLTVLNPSFDVIDDLAELTTDPVVLKLIGRVRNAFFKDTVDKDASEYKNLAEQIQVRAGIIVNMFRESGNQNQNYLESNVSEVIEFSDEEKEENKKAALKAKQEQSKNA